MGACISTVTLFSTPFDPISEGLTLADLAVIDGNERVDVNATGATRSGQISTNDTVLIENELATLPTALVDSEVLLASSCIVRGEEDGGVLRLTGRDRLPLSSTISLAPYYPTSSLQTSETTIQEPQSIYQLSDGRLIMSHVCSYD